MIRRLLPLVIFVLTMPQSLLAEMVADSNTAYFAGERFDLILSAPRGYQLITSEAQSEGYACAIIPVNETFKSASHMLGINFFRIRGMSFDRAVTQDTLNIRILFGTEFSMQPVSSLPFLTGDSLEVIKLGGGKLPMSADFFGYFDAGTDMLIVEASRSTSRSIADTERLLRETIALAKVLTRAEERKQTVKP